MKTTKDFLTRVNTNGPFRIMKLFRVRRLVLISRTPATEDRHFHEAVYEGRLTLLGKLLHFVAPWWGKCKP